MIARTLLRISKMSCLSLWRNRWLSLAATVVMILTLLIISFFLSILVITDKTTESLRDKVDMSVYFNDNVSKDQILAIQNILLSRADVKSVDYVSKEKALEIWQTRNKDNEKIRDIITEKDNPLPRSLGVKTTNPEDLEAINTYLSGDDFKPLVKEISYRKNKDLITRLVKITSFLKVSGWSLSLIFVLVSILVIFNTVRLTIFARSEEIDIMKLVGASDWYIRGPFIIEGLGYGLIGSLVAGIIFFFGFRITVPMAEKYLGLYNLNAAYLGINYWSIIILQVALGILLGTVCSILAMRKHLK